MPSGAAIRSDSSVISIVVTIAGNSETFSVVYSSSNSDGVRYGIPLARMYTTMNTSMQTVISAARQTSSASVSESGWRRYDFMRCPALIRLIARIFLRVDFAVSINPSSF